MKTTEQHENKEEEEYVYPKSSNMNITASPLMNRTRLSAHEVNAVLNAQPEYRTLFANVAEYNAILDNNGISSPRYVAPRATMKPTSSNRRLTDDDDGEELTTEVLNEMFDHDCRVVQYLRDNDQQQQQQNK